MASNSTVAFPLPFLLLLLREGAIVSSVGCARFFEMRSGEMERAKRRVGVSSGDGVRAIAVSVFWAESLTWEARWRVDDKRRD